MQRVSTIHNISVPNLSEEDAVAGTNRIRLLRVEEKTRNDGRWADKMRNLVQAREYLCHIGEAIEWIENFLNEKIDDHNTKEASIVELEKTIHDGVVLAKLARRIDPSIIPNIISGDEKLKFLRSNNINAFLKAAKEVGLPSIFLFEFVDIYDGKNMPKVIYCIHALSHLLHSNSYAPKIKNLKDEFNFSDDVLVATQRNLERSGASMPNFKNLSSSLQKELNGHKKNVYSFKPIEEPAVVNEREPLPHTQDFPKDRHNRHPEELFVEDLYESDSESRSSLSDDNEINTLPTMEMEILHFLDSKNASSISLSDSDMEYNGSETLGLDSDDDDTESQDMSNAYYATAGDPQDQVALQGFAHAYMSQNNLQNVKEQQRYHAFQSTVPYMQSRIFTGSMDSQFGEKRREYFRDSEDFITSLQAMCRRYLAMKNKQYYIEQHNIISDQVGAEGTFSAEYHERAYQKLKSEKNPSIGVVKSVLHMFNNNDVDFTEDLIIEELRQKVVESIRNNNLLDAHVSMMDIQIALCLKNAMTSDEVVKFNNTFFNLNRKKQQQQRFSELLSSNSSTNPYDLRGVDKAHRDKLELYQQLVYLLQTEPQYLARLMSITGAQVYGEKKGQRRIDDTVLALFGYGTNSREECLLINLCKACISQEMKRVKSPQEFMRGNYTFMKLVVQVNRGAREREFFTQLFQGLIDKVLSDSSLDLETNPIVIYRKCIQNEETATGQPTKRAPEVSLDQALREPDVLRLLNEHMDSLMRLTDEFLSNIIKQVDTMPYGMRVIARELRLVMEDTFPEEEPENIVKILGNFIFYRYLSPVITAPEQYISVSHGISPLQRNNLAEISKTLQHISNGKCLANTQSRALNEYIMSASPRFIQWFLDLTNVEEPEQHFGLGELSDYTNTQKPTVYVHPIDLYHMHHLLEDNVSSIERQPAGILHQILGDLGEAPVVPSNNTSLHLLRLELSDRRDNVLPEMEGDVKKLLLDAKRLIILVIQVQSGPTLEDILKAPVTDKDEETWRLVREKVFPSEGTEQEIEMALREREFKFGYKAAAMDVKSLSFGELKSFAYGLHNHLMKHGIIPESPGYQSIINMIAVDITKKGERRKLRNAEIKKLQHILANLEEKHEFLLGQYTAFKKYWDSSIENMAKKRGEKKRFTLPFTRQYFHIKNLQKRGLVPKYSSFKYSAKDLHERGIIVDLVGVDKRFYSKIMITLSMDCPGVIAFEANFPMTNTHLHVDVQYEELLNAQYEGVSKKEVLEGMAVVNVNLLLYLINKKFYLTA